MRQIRQTDTRIPTQDGSEQFEPNPAVRVYDCAGPYSDPNAAINVRQGLINCASWILERDDTQELTSVSSSFTQQRLADEGWII